jgi:DNA-directed RNA polymerase specialized sigma24 family protein
MEDENSDIENMSNSSIDEFIKNFRKFFSYTESIIHHNGLQLNSYTKVMLEDALTDAFIMYYLKGIEIDEPVAFKHWICKTAYNNFRNGSKQYKNLEFCDICEFDNLSSEFIDKSFSNYSEAEIKEHLKGYCSEEDFEFLEKHWIEGYTFPELSDLYNTNVSALQQRHKRLMDKLKINLSPPLNNYFFVI